MRIRRPEGNSSSLYQSRKLFDMRATAKVSNTISKPVFTDARGGIFDLVEDKIGHIGMVTFKKGAVRGNHYHKKSTQYSYVISGRLRLTVSNIDGSNRRTYVLKEGTVSRIPPRIIHTYQALTAAKLLDMTSLSRTDNGYEHDTVRCKKSE